VTDPEGMVVPCTNWSHFAVAPHASYEIAQGAVKHDFWVRVLFNTNFIFDVGQRHNRVEPEAQEHADQVLEKNVKKVSKDAFANARLQVVNAYMKHRGCSINNFRQY
jgi:hypothetical protein